HVLPDLRAGEADDGLHAQLLREAGGVLHVLCGALAHALGVAVAPDLGADDRLMAEIDRVVADGLALEVVGDRPAAEAMLLEDAEALGDVVVIVPAARVQVLAGDGDLEAVIAPAGG